MQATLTTFTREGRAWQPSYLLEINPALCIGCGRCFKVCGQRVMELKGIDEDGNLVELGDDDVEIERKIMTLVDAGACIGCAACARACPKDCQTHGFA